MSSNQEIQNIFQQYLYQKKSGVFFFISFIILLTSCNKYIDNTISGSWSIDTIYYKSNNMLYCLDINVLDFFADYKCELPTTENYCSEIVVTFERKGKWAIHQTDSIPLVMRIESKNEMLSGNFRIIFKKDDSKRLLKMELISEDVYLVCRKGLFSYNENKELIERLIKISGDKIH